MKTRKQSRRPMSDFEDDDDEDFEEDRFNRRALRTCRAMKRRSATMRLPKKSPRTHYSEPSPQRELEESEQEEEEEEEKEEEKESPPPKPVYKNNKTSKQKTKKATNSSQRQPSNTCNFCNTSDTEYQVYELGEMKRCEDVTAHMYCLFFAPGLTMNGQADEGIDGFLLSDIRKELRRASQLKCSYCDKRSAAIGCGVASCSANFHLPCGLQNGVFTQFHDPNNSFPAFCKRHRPKEHIPSFKGTVLCTICQENVKPVDRSKLLFLPCCQTYFHRACLSQLAYYQGEFSLNCPNCKNIDQFIPVLKKNGIYVPCRDFLADNEPVNVNESVQWNCSAAKCICKDGRNHNGDNEWELFSCDNCGHNAVHMACAGLSEGSEWSCEVCSSVV